MLGSNTRVTFFLKIMDTLYGQIHLATHKTTGTQYFVKRVVRRVLHPREAKAVNDEIAVLRAASECRQILNIHEVYEDADITAIVMDHVKGQPLIDQLIERKSIHESDAKALARNLLTAVDFLHKRRIANRNLTLDNLILVSDSYFSTLSNRGLARD
jgi:serine/threonine protein kinase